jgi:pimeloyl-ACP methyl ester carboxylesterase
MRVDSRRLFGFGWLAAIASVGMVSGAMAQAEAGAAAAKSEAAKSDAAKSEAGSVIAAGDSPLPRRASIGLGLGMVDGQMVIGSVKPSGAADRAGVQVGDVLLAINDAKVVASGDLSNAMRGRKGGQSVTLLIRRGDEDRTISVTLDAVEPELVDGSAVTYSSVVVPGGYRLRTIITEPTDSAIASPDGRHPAFLYVQGIYCASLDRPSNPNSVDTKLVHAMAKAGFVTIRVDKPGLGDSEGPACGEIGFETELDGYKAALRQLASLPSVDPDRIYLFGHSMGGVMMPYLTREVPVRGSIVYGTLTRTWLEYQLENTRRQMTLMGATPAEINDAVQGEAKTSAMILIDGKTLGDVWERYPELRSDDPMVDATHIASRHVRFFKDLQDLNLARAWEESTGDVLAIHGEYDWVTDASDHAMIAEIVNGRSPGAGTHVELAKADHGFTTHATLEDSLSAMGKGTWDQNLLSTVLEWIAKVEGREAK